jgi:hypothetical protein
MVNGASCTVYPLAFGIEAAGPKHRAIPLTKPGLSGRGAARHHGSKSREVTSGKI